MSNRIDKEEVISFFDKQAPSWDDRIVRNNTVIGKILDNACVSEGKDVLDVACGTGVLVQDYLDREVHSVTAIDISPQMITVAESKFHQDNVNFICADAEELKCDKSFDVIMIYNAFPHFAHQEKLLKHLCSLLSENGTISVAHGMSRKKIDSHHLGVPETVSQGLMKIEELAELLGKYVEVTTTVSDDDMYQIVGRKRNK